MRTSILVLSMAFAFNAHAEVVTEAPKKMWEDLADLAKRTLVVELPELNSELVASFGKKNAEELTAAYEASLASYLAEIEPAVRKYWTFNDKIEFKPTSEILQLFKDKNADYVVLMKGVLGPKGEVTANTFSSGAPILIFSGPEVLTKANKKGELLFVVANFRMYLATTATDEDKESYSEAAMKFSLVQGQKTMEWEVKTNRKMNFGYLPYAKEQSGMNCAKLAAKKLLVDQAGLSNKMDRAEAMDAYGPNLELVDRAEVESAYLSGDSAKAVLFSLPVATKSGIGTYWVYMKVVVDPSTNEILNATETGLSASFVRGVEKSDLRALSKCK